MKLTNVLLLAAALTGWTNAAAYNNTADAVKDITTQYFTNPSFEADNIASLEAVNNNADGLRGYKVTAPKGWTVVNSAGAVSLVVTKDCYTDNNFGKVTTLADEQQAYYLRMGWSTGSTTVKQTAAQLPKGKYRVSAQVRSGYANSASSSIEMTVGGATMTYPFTKGSAGCFTTMKWQELATEFEQTTDGAATLSFAVTWLSGGSCVMIDDIRLYRLNDDYVMPTNPTEQDILSPTEGTVTTDFVSETVMQGDLLQMLANFTTWIKADYQACVAPNSIGEECGCFKGEDTMANNERGVRPNADLSMICAFLVKYGKGKVTLPTGVTWSDLEDLAMKTLVFAYSTHKANKLKVCKGNNYWGSVSTTDNVWESSLWAMSVAYSAFFQWDRLTEAQRGYIYQLLKAECNYELYRSVPTGYSGDTKSEENGWEADVLAATLGLFPNDELAPKWFERLRLFAINSYSQKNDASNSTVIDPDYDQKTVKDLYRGQNLYDDFTLQNHNYFHTSYQNVVAQELGEAALALKLFQKELYGEEKWQTRALMHNCQEVMDNVLYDLALADGELAMPNGNDWSLFLYDQITSYSTVACFLRDPRSLLLENLAYKMIKARQTTTADGSWLLRADVGARRMGVEAHRVMMTWLMHNQLSTANLTPTTWPAFLSQYSRAKVFTSQNIVRAATDSRFTCFSWSKGLKSYTGYIAANSVDKNKIIVPFRANDTGNFLGWYDVEGKSTNATPVVSGNYQTGDMQTNGSMTGENAYVMNGELQTNDATLNNRFAIYSTPGNAVIYIDYVRANADATITTEKGGLMAISTDELTKTHRTLYYPADATIAHRQLDGTAFTTLSGPWVNVDNALGIITAGGKQTAFGERANNNSVMTAKLYPLYSSERRTVKRNDIVDSRTVVYYSSVTAEETSRMSSMLTPLTLPQGWHGVVAFDPDSTGYLMLSNFVGALQCSLGTINTPLGIAVLPVRPDTIISVNRNNSFVCPLKFFVDDASSFSCVLDRGNPNVAYLTSTSDSESSITVRAITANGVKEKTVKTAGKLKATIAGDELLIEEVATPITAIRSNSGRSQNKNGSHASVISEAASRDYNISGRNVTHQAKGIHIATGRKYIVR